MENVVPYNNKDSIMWLDKFKDDATRKTMYSEISDLNYASPQYSIEAYSTDNRANYSIQLQNNMLLPIYGNAMASRYLRKYLNTKEKGKEKNYDGRYLIIVEKHLIKDSFIHNIYKNYYHSIMSKCTANTKENCDINAEVKDRVSKGKFPIEIKILHLIDIDVAFNNSKATYLPDLNMMIYNSNFEINHEHPIGREFNVGDRLPAFISKDRGMTQLNISVVDKKNKNKTYYTKILGETVDLKSTDSIHKEEGIILEEYSEGLETRRLKINIEDIRDYGIYPTRTECNNSESIDKVIELKKTELELDKLRFGSKKMSIEFNMFSKKCTMDISRNNIDITKMNIEIVKLRKDLLEDNLLSKKGKRDGIDTSKGLIDITTSILKLASMFF